MSSDDIGPAGPPGERGPRGTTGDIGPPGAKGLTGITGAVQGPTGDKGQTGNTGPQGVQGLQGIPGDAGSTGYVGNYGQCKLTRVSSSQLKLIPFNGNAIKINGTIYAIPSAGLTINKSSLNPNTIYPIYAMIQTGAPVLTVSPATTHGTSTTAGNVGMEVLSGNINTHTLVGMARTDASTNFVDTPTQRFVRSWFNDDGITAIANTSTNKSVNVRSFTEVDTLAQVEVLTWVNEYFIAAVNARSFNTAGAWCYLGVWLNAAAVGSFGAVGNDGANAVSFSNTGIAGDVLTEGYNRFSIGCFSDTGAVFHYERGVTVKTMRR